jgi:hypothetical protein
MKANNYRTCLIAGSALTLAISGLIQAQQPASIEPVLREVSIMRNIFAGALEQGSRTNKFFGSGQAPDALYLAGQGMVFSFNLPGGGFAGFGSFCGGDCGNLDFFVDDINVAIDPAPPAPPAPPASPAPPGVTTIARMQENQRAFEEQLRAREAELRAKQEELRARNEELREVNRELRDLGREQRSDPDNEELSAQMDALEATMNELAQNVEREGEAYRQTIEEIQTERTAAINVQRQAQIDQVLGVLCDYGSTLKALPGNEHVSLVFRNFTGDTDQIIVISHADVTDCTSIDNLKQAAVSYQQ